MMPTKDSVSCPPLITLGSQQDILTADSSTLDIRPVSQSTARLPVPDSAIQDSTTNNSSRQRLIMDNRLGGYAGAGNSNINPLPEEGTKIGSGRRGDPVEILQFSQDSTYNFEDEEEGLSVIPPSPERSHGPTLGPKSPLSRDNINTGDSSMYASHLESPDRTAKSPNWMSSKRTPMYPWEIPRRITFSQESSQQSFGTPHETQECLSGYAQRHMSPDKALKRSYYSSSEEADSKKRKTTTPTKTPTTDNACTIRSPYGSSQNNIKSKEASPRSRESVPHQTPPSFFKVRLKVPPPLSDSQYNEKSSPSPSAVVANKEPTWSSTQCHSATDSWHLRLSESQDSQSQPEMTPTSATQLVSTYSSRVEAQATTHTDFTSAKKVQPLDDEFASPVKRGHSSSSRAVNYLLVDRKHLDPYKKRTSTPFQVSGSEDNSLEYPKSTYRTVPPLVLQLSRQSTITPTSTAMTTTPSPRSLSQFSEEHISPPLQEESQTDKILVDSTETSAILHQISNSSIDTSAFEPSLEEHSTLEQQQAVQLPTSTEQTCALLQSSRTPDTAAEHSTVENQQGTHLEVVSNPQPQSTTSDGVPESNIVPRKDASKFLFSPELNVENGEVPRQKKRPHSDEEFVRNVRRTRDSSVQTDTTSESHSQSSQTQTMSLVKGVDQMTLHSGSSESQSEHGTLVRFRDALYRYKDHIVDGCIVKCERVNYEERIFDNCRLEDLPPLISPPQDSNQHWSSLTSGEMADVSSSVPSSKSGSYSSLQSFSLPNSMSQLSQVQLANMKKKRRSVSLQTLLDKRAQATPQPSLSTMSSGSPVIRGTEQDDCLFTKPLEPNEVPKLPSKEAESAPPTNEEMPQVPEMVWTTPTKRSGGRSHKKGAKRLTMVKRRTPKSASPKKVLQRSSSSTSSPDAQPPIVKTSPEQIDSPVSPGNFRSGMQVMARWKDSYFYSGTLSEMDATGKWEVNFEDGSQRCVKESEILDETLVVKGQSVLALSKDGYYDPGIVQSLYCEDKEQGFIVDLDVGVAFRCKRGTVILSSDQAALLLRRRNVDLPVAALSLDNIVEGKRRRTPKHFADNGSPASAPRPMATRALGILPQQPPLQPTRRRKPDPNIQSSDFNTSMDEQKECPSLIPRLKLQRSKKDPDQYWCSDAEPEEVAESSRISPLPALDEANTVPIRSPNKKGSPKKSPKKASPSKNTPTKNNTSELSTVQDDDEVEKGLGPFSEDNTIFQGLYFLISCADRSASQNKSSTDSSVYSSDSSPEEETIPHLDRDHVSLQLQNAGGVVLESFEDTLNVPKKQVVLISNTFLRTLKYIKCLAAGIPCVSVDWVNASCEKSKRLQMNLYMLPAGYNIVDDCVVDWNNRSTNVLCNMKVMLWSEKNLDFVPFWTPVLLAAQASAVARPLDSTQFKGNFGHHVNVVVADPSLPTNIFRHFRDQLKTPVVSSEWLIQCIITGKKLPFDIHPKFKHTYVNG